LRWRSTILKQEALSFAAKAFSLSGALRPLDVLSSGCLVQAQAWLLRCYILSLSLHPPAERHQIATQMDERSRGDSARQRLRDPHHSNVGVDRAVERKVLGQRVHEHECVIDVTADNRLFGAGLGQTKPSLRVRIQLAAEDRFREQISKCHWPSSREKFSTWMIGTEHTSR